MTLSYSFSSFVSFQPHLFKKLLKRLLTLPAQVATATIERGIETMFVPFIRGQLSCRFFPVRRIFSLDFWKNISYIVNILYLFEYISQYIVVSNKQALA